MAPESLNATTSSTALIRPTLKLWTVDAYHQMSEFGILSPDERTELISGHITVMAAKGTAHVTALRLLATQLDSYLQPRPFFASTQDPIYISESSEPEPDLAIVKGSISDYATRHPIPTDVVLIVEVADSTLKYDLTVKSSLYAEAGIPEYWVQDLKNCCLHIFSDPSATGYQNQQVLYTQMRASPQAFADLSLSVASIFSRPG